MLGYVEVSEASKLFVEPQDGSAEIASLRQGVVVRVIDEANDYYKVSYEGASGYLDRGVAIESTVEAFVRQLGSPQTPAPRAPTPPRAELEAMEEEPSGSSASQPVAPPAPAPLQAGPGASREEEASAPSANVAVAAPESEGVPGEPTGEEESMPLADEETADDDDDNDVEHSDGDRPFGIGSYSRRFAALSTIATGFQMLGWIIMAAGIGASILGGLVAGSGEDGSAAAAAAIVIAGIGGSLIAGIVVFAYGDLIALLIDIERNTRAMAMKIDWLD